MPFRPRITRGTHRALNAKSGDNSNGIATSRTHNSLLRGWYCLAEDVFEAFATPALCCLQGQNSCSCPLIGHPQRRCECDRRGEASQRSPRVRPAIPCGIVQPGSQRCQRSPPRQQVATRSPVAACCRRLVLWMPQNNLDPFPCRRLRSGHLPHR